VVYDTNVPAKRTTSFLLFCRLCLKESIPLTKLELNKKGIITDIIFSDYGLFERIVSMGIFLGEKIRVMYEIPDGIVVNVGGKKFALGKDIAKEIEVLG